MKPVAQKSPKPIKIAVLGLENNPFWIPVKEGTMKAAEELKPLGCTVDWINAGAQHTTDVFSKAIEAAMAQGYDAIATIAGDSGIVPLHQQGRGRGHPRGDVQLGDRLGQQAPVLRGRRPLPAGPDGGQDTWSRLSEARAKSRSSPGSSPSKPTSCAARDSRTRSRRKRRGSPIVGRVENKDKADTAYSQAQDFMTANPDLNAIYVTAGGPFGAAKAVEDAGKAGKVKIVCYDFVDETMQFVKSGVITGTLGQDPFAQGHDPAIRLYNYLVGGVVPPAGRLLTKADFVTKDNISQFYNK